MSSRLLAWCTLAVLAVLAASLQVLPAAHAVYLPKNYSFTLASEPGSFVGGDREWHLDESNALLVVQNYSPSRSDIYMDFTVPGTYVRWNVHVAGVLVDDTGKRQPLVAGHYQAVRPITQTPGKAGFSAEGGHSCDNVGSMDVRTVHFNGGVVDRLWLVFDMTCGSAAHYFGEVRVGMDTPALAVAPAAIAWPDHTYPRDDGARPVAVQMRSTRAARVRSVSLVGPHPRQFTVLEDTCTGRQANDCTVTLTYDPTRPGPATAALRMVTSRGVRLTSLDAIGAVGTTRLDLASEPGDWVGQGKTYAFTTSAAQFTVGMYSPYWLGATVRTYNGRHRWSLDFVSTPGEPLSERTYTDVWRAGFGNAPAMDAFGDSRGCNDLTGDFTVHDFATGAQGLVKYVDVTFVQYCDGNTAALRGRLRYHAGPDHTPAPQVRDLRLRRADGRILAHWTNPRPASGFAGVTARWYWGPDAVASTPTVGRLAYAGAETSLSIPDPSPDRPVTVTFFTHDAVGNISQPLPVAR